MVSFRQDIFGRNTDEDPDHDAHTGGAVIIARSTSYVLTKVGLQDMGKFTLLAVRFLLAFAFLAVLFWRRLL